MTGKYSDEVKPKTFNQSYIYGFLLLTKGSDWLLM